MYIYIIYILNIYIYNDIFSLKSVTVTTLLLYIHTQDKSI